MTRRPEEINHAITQDPIVTRFSPFSLLCRMLLPTQVQSRVSLGLPPKPNTRMSASSNLPVKPRGSQTTNLQMGDCWGILQDIHKVKGYPGERGKV